MKYLFLIELIFILFACSLAHELNDQESQIEHRPRAITKDTFSQTLDEPSSGTFVMYYAPWCGHCKRMITTWTDLAQKHNHQKRFLIGKIDCTTETEFCSENDILGYPTFIFYKKSDLNGIRYDGARDLESLELFMYNHLSADQKTLNDVKTDAGEVTSLTDSNFDNYISQGFHFVKFFAPWCGHCQRMADTWKELATKYVNTNIKISEVDCTKQVSACQANDVKGYPTLLFFHNGKKIESYNDQRTLEAFTIFIETTVAKLENSQEDTSKVIELNGQNYHNFVNHKGLIFVKFFAPWCGHCRNMAPTWVELARKVGTKIKIAEVDCTQNNEICNENNVNGYPTLLLFKNGQKLEDYSGARDISSLISFLNKYLIHEEL